MYKVFQLVGYDSNVFHIVTGYIKYTYNMKYIYRRQLENDIWQL